MEDTTMAKWQQPWEKKHRTVRAICVDCMKTSHITLNGTPSEYRELMKSQACPHCGIIGKLNTSDLAKVREKLDRSYQLVLNWKK